MKQQQPEWRQKWQSNGGQIMIEYNDDDNDEGVNDEGGDDDMENEEDVSDTAGGEKEMIPKKF